MLTCSRKRNKSPLKLFTSLFFRPDLNDAVLDPETGLSIVSLPRPVGILDQTQASLTQRILDNLGSLDVGMSQHVIYGQRRGEVKAYSSFSKFDSSRQPREISKLNPEPLYQVKDFLRGAYRNICLCVTGCAAS